MPVKSFPLEWPQGVARTPLHAREAGQFKTDFDAALKNVRKSLELFAKDSGKALNDPVLSTNKDPNPLADRNRRVDPGVAVWFTWDGMQVAIAVDRYQTPAANLQAIHHIIEARRTELRHGTLAMVRATFTGFKALPAPAGKHWREILKLTDRSVVTSLEIEAAYREQAKTAHPDAGGSSEAMAELSQAKRLGLAEVGG